MADLIREAIRDRALASGFDAVGFAEARLDEEARSELSEFIARGYHGDMGWLAGTATRRGDPRLLWPEARTIVVLGVNYAPDDDPLALADMPDCGILSVYARGSDYHDFPEMVHEVFNERERGRVFTEVQKVLDAVARDAARRPASA